MKLELKHLAPYLLYGLNFYVEHKNGSRLDNWIMNVDTNLRQIIVFQNKPILKPLSELEDYFQEVNKPYNYPDFGHMERSILSGHASFEFVNELIQDHYDVFGLIEKGLAVNENLI